MPTVHLVCGPQGAGKTSYARRLAVETNATCFSIDEWMIDLFGADLPAPLDFTWIMERVARCQRRIWRTAADIAARGGCVVLDLGFIKVTQRDHFVSMAKDISCHVQIHFLDAPPEVRRARVAARNAARGDTFAFEVTPAMFDFMEPQYEPATEHELSHSAVRATA